MNRVRFLGLKQLDAKHRKNCAVTRQLMTKKVLKTLEMKLDAAT